MPSKQNQTAKFQCSVSCPLNLEKVLQLLLYPLQILLITAALPTNLPQQTNDFSQNVWPALIHKRHFVRCVRKFPAAQDLQGCIAKEVSFKQKKPDTFLLHTNSLGWGEIWEQKATFHDSRDAES